MVVARLTTHIKINHQLMKALPNPSLPLFPVLLVAVSAKKEAIVNKATSRRCQGRKGEKLNRISNESVGQVHVCLCGLDSYLSP